MNRHRTPRTNRIALLVAAVYLAFHHFVAPRRLAKA